MKEQTPKDTQDLSNIELDMSDSENFLIDIGKLVKQSAGQYDYLLKEKNFGVRELTEDQKEVKTADNIFTLRNFMRDNFNEIRKNPVLQRELKLKIENLKRTTVKDGPERALLMTLEMQINDLIQDNEETD